MPRCARSSLTVHNPRLKGFYRCRALLFGCRLEDDLYGPSLITRSLDGLSQEHDFSMASLRVDLLKAATVRCLD